MQLNQSFLQVLRQQWYQNPVVATLNARLSPMEIPIEVIQKAENLQQQALNQQNLWRERQSINQQVETQLGTLGIFSQGNHFGSGLGIGWNDPNASEVMFYGVMAEIRRSQGNPQLISPALTSQAAAILRGQVNPIQVFILMSSQVQGYGQLAQGLWQMLESMLGGLPPILKQLALVLAALSVPQDQILGLLADPRLQNPNQNQLNQNQNELSGLLNIFSNMFC